MRPMVNIHNASDDFPLDAMLAEREKARLDAAWEAAGGVNLDLSEEGMQQAAEGGQQIDGTNKITSPLESTSETVRDRASEIAGEGPVRQGLDKVLKTLTGSDLATLEKSVNEGTLPKQVGMKLLDPVGNISEELLREGAKGAGLDAETAQKIATTGGLALGMLFPPGGGIGKVAKAEEAAAAAMKAVKKAPWQMTREELVTAARAAKAEDKGIAVEIFGAAKAKEYEQLQRTANSTTDLARADAASAKVAEMENRLTPEQQNRLFGIGTDFVGADVYEDFRKAIDRVGGDTPKELGESLRWAVTRAGEGDTQTAQMAKAQIRRGFEIAQERGFDTKAVSEAALKAAAARHRDPEDALYMLQSFLKDAPPAGGAGGGGALPALPAGGGGGGAGGVLAGPRAMEGMGAARMAGSAPDVQAVAKKIAAFNAERMTAGKVSHAETIAKAETAMPLADALALDVTKYDMATIQTAVAGHYKSVEAYYRDVAKRLIGGDKAAEADYWAAFAMATDLAQKDALLGTQMGRGLEARKIALEQLRGSTDPASLQQMAQTMAGGVETGMDAVIHAARMLALKPAQRDVALRQTAGFWATGRNAFLEAWINGLMSGPQTHVANFLSTASMAAWAPFERALAADADFILTGGGTWAQRNVYYGEVPQMMYGMVEGLKDGVKMLGAQIREEMKVFKGKAPEFVGGGENLKMERANAITAEAFGMNPATMWGGTVDLIGGIVRGSGRGLMTEDGILKAVNYRMELRALAYREAANEGLTGKDFWGRVKKIIKEADTTGGAAKDGADQFKLMNTLNRSFAEMGMVGSVGQAVSDGVNKVPMLRVLAPFVRTPTNDLHFASERVPVLSMISDTIRADIQAGGASQSLAIAKMTGGMGVSAVIATYAAQPINPESPTPYMNMITGEGPKDPRMKAELLALGWQPYSVWNPISEKYVSVRRFPPLGTIMGIVANYKEISGRLPEMGATEIAQAAGIATSKAMLSKTFLTGLADFVDAMEGDTQDINRFFEGLARSGVPAILRQSTRTLDPIKRDVDTLVDHWRAGLPGYDGPPDHNLWGDEIHYEGGLGPDIVSPYYTTTPVKPGDDPVGDWLVKNKIAISGAPKAVGHAAAGETPYLRPEADKPIHLTTDERQRLKVLIGKGGQAPTDYGDLGPLEGTPTLKDKLAEFIRGSGTDGPGGTKADMIQSYLNDRKTAAIRQLRRESPMLDRELSRRQAESLGNKTGTPADPATFMVGPGLTIPGARR